MYGGDDSGHGALCSNRDYDFFYEGLEAGKILIQRCDNCGRLRNPPSPMCGECQSLAWSATPMAGTGTIYSYTVHYHPPIPGFSAPHPMGVIALDEGIRFLAGLDGVPIDEIEIGLPVRAEFIRRGNFATVCFRRA